MLGLQLGFESNMTSAFAAGYAIKKLALRTNRKASFLLLVQYEWLFPGKDRGDYASSGACKVRYFFAEIDLFFFRYLNSVNEETLIHTANAMDIDAAGFGGGSPEPL